MEKIATSRPVARAVTRNDEQNEYFSLKMTLYAALNYPINILMKMPL